MKLLINGKKEVTLSQTNYKASGGEGTVYEKDGLAFKIYADPKRMISVAKIQELNGIPCDNVLAPKDVLYDPSTKSPVGFTMPFVQDVEFLCRFFNRNFRDDNHVTPQMVVDLVKKMQSTLQIIHKQKILVVDFNEMNFLIDKTFTLPYFIDVDSYQTPSFPATALMESVRDRKAVKNKFSQETDWFSFAVVSFQLYVGIHPFKGRHPDYKPTDWSKRMDDGISVFDKGVSLPASCQDFSVIPKPHLEWYRRVFINHDRSRPPFPDQVIVGMVQTTLISSTDGFEVELFEDYKSRIVRVYDFNNVIYTVTHDKVFSVKKPYLTFFDSPKKAGLIFVLGEEPVIVTWKNGMATLQTVEQEVGKIAASDIMFSNGAAYTVSNSQLIENTCNKIGKTLVHQFKVVCSIFEPSYKVFRGVVTQDIVGKCFFSIPFKQKFCATMAIPELDGHRIIDVVYQSGICISISEKSGKYFRCTFCFDSSCSTYTSRIAMVQEVDTVNMVVLQNGVCVTVLGDESVEVFTSNTKVKEVKNPPFNSSMRLYSDGPKVLFADRTKLHSVKLK